MLPDLSRYIADVAIPAKLQGKSVSPLDLFNPLTVKPIYGVPVGGIGCGTIGRGYKGEFCRSSLIPGRFNYDVGVADQFILTVKKNGTCLYHQVLSPPPDPVKRTNCFQSWKWSTSPGVSTFIGLYPRSWTIYNIPELKLLLICKQVSPVIPNNYKDSCLPVGAFKWTAVNFDTDADVDISITMTWRGPRAPVQSPPQNVGTAGTVCCEIGHAQNYKAEEYTIPFDDAENQLCGCLLETLIDDMPCCFGIASKSSERVEVTRSLGFRFGDKGGRGQQSPRGEQPSLSPWGVASHTASPAQDAVTATEFWTNLGLHGKLAADKSGYYVGLNKNRPKIGVAVCASFKVPAATKAPSADGEDTPGQETCDFFLTWHMPRVHFRSSLVAYKRRYTRWFSEDTIAGASELLTYTCQNIESWDSAIESWQAHILEDSGLPPWYKSALFNELYYLSDGGTVWLDPIPSVRVNKSDDGPSSANTQSPSGIPLDEVRSRNPNVTLDPNHLTARNPPTNAAGAGDELADLPERELLRIRANVANDMGLFAYLESHEYLMYNTYDVHFNASWALIKLWPKLQLAVNYDLADMTMSEDRTPMQPIFKGTRNKKRIRSNTLAVPHDCGDPEDEPWVRINAYTLHATDEWKDLNPKFVLMAWRDWKLTSDDNYMLYMLPLIVKVMQSCLERWDSDGDGLIENGGFADQTYDMWKTKGVSFFSFPSAYVGGIWLAALYATIEMVSHAHSNELVPDKKSNYETLKTKFEKILATAKSSYHEKLWTGVLFGFVHPALVTPLQLTQLSSAFPVLRVSEPCLHDWRACARLPRSLTHRAGHSGGYEGPPVGGVGGAVGPNAPILPGDSVSIVINSIVKSNWQSVCKGKMGAINGIYQNLEVVTTNIESQEFWVGINYCLASLLILEGMPIDGFDLCGACFNTVYEDLGLQYQTPEAYTREKHYRAPGYMRPLAIWSIQQAVDLRQPRYTGANAMEK
ncbi:unnamed protein product [Mesocestoides corti]|uniref:Non-lysosomal glucosylceramidase n=1 Tax=Mesocestoides corti TaxID=53468 RepID=A0A158QUG2_MESCO|nr:unnamed protein product [Mesocestoides corti]